MKAIWAVGCPLIVLLACSASAIAAESSASGSADVTTATSAIQAAANRLSDAAFDLLTSLNAEAYSSPDTSKPLLGPAANLAADAHTLSQAILRSDGERASYALKSLRADRIAMDSVFSVRPGKPQAGKWVDVSKGIDDLLAVSTSIAALRPSDAAVAHEPSPPANIASAPSASGDTPQVRILSVKSTGDGQVLLKGYIEGRGLKSAGVYQSGQELKAFDVSNVPGMQRLNFQLQLEQVEPGMQIRARDFRGLVASADINAANRGVMESSSAPPTAPSAATADIPSRMPLSKRHIERHTLSHLGDIKIDLTNVSIGGEGQCRVQGKISGSNIRSAGIYVDGRPVADIPVSGYRGSSSNYFDVPFMMTGRLASIRAYRSTGQYVENLIPTHPAETSFSGASSFGRATPYGGAAVATMPQIEVAGIQPIGPSTWFVSGMIYGANLASAGLYQNGTLVQQFAVNTGSPGSQQVAFSARFNSNAGVATIRAFNTAGVMAEQPLMVSSVMGRGFPGFGFGPFGGSMGFGGSTRTAPGSSGGLGGMLNKFLPW